MRKMRKQTTSCTATNTKRDKNCWSLLLKWFPSCTYALTRQKSGRLLDLELSAARLSTLGPIIVIAAPHRVMAKPKVMDVGCSRNGRLLAGTTAVVDGDLLCKAKN